MQHAGIDPTEDVVFASLLDLPQKLTFAVGEAVVVATRQSGVYYGRVIRFVPEENLIILQDARECYQWAHLPFGILSLMLYGPNLTTLTSGVVPRITLLDVEHVFPCSAQATLEWERSK